MGSYKNEVEPYLAQRIIQASAKAGTRWEADIVHSFFLRDTMAEKLEEKLGMPSKEINVILDQEQSGLNQMLCQAKHTTCEGHATINPARVQHAESLTGIREFRGYINDKLVVNGKGILEKDKVRFELYQTSFEEIEHIHAYGSLLICLSGQTTSIREAQELGYQQNDSVPEEPEGWAEERPPVEQRDAEIDSRDCSEPELINDREDVFYPPVDEWSSQHNS
ncbi:MAG: hypothetical protein AABY01_02885 [Nanoarchaeota archaeon]